MKITVFTSNQPRHLSLVRRMASVSEQTFAILECSTTLPGNNLDYLKTSEVKRRYFEKVILAEKSIYGDINLIPSNVKTLSIGMGELNNLSISALSNALASDLYLVFGASYIKGWLIDFLIQKKAINIHMGVSPYYRGAACNFWALFDKRPEYVGSTIHFLSKGLDSGDILYHAMPTLVDEDPFVYTMKSVEAAQISLVEKICTKDLFSMMPMPQDKSEELRYSRSNEFTDDIAAEFLSFGLSNAMLKDLLNNSIKYPLLSPFYL